MSTTGTSKKLKRSNEARRAAGNDSNDEDGSAKVFRKEDDDKIEDDDEEYELDPYKTISEADKKKALDLCKKAQRYHRMNNTDKAFEIFKEVIRLDPNLTEPFLARANVHMIKRNFGLVIKNCNRVLELNQNHPVGYRMRGQAKMKLEKYNEALEDLNKSVGILADITTTEDDGKEVDDENSDELQIVKEAIVEVNEKIEIKKSQDKRQPKVLPPSPHPRIDIVKRMIKESKKIPEDQNMEQENELARLVEEQFVQLKPHQRRALKFMYDREEHYHGGILADDMGLGKTVSVLSLIYLTKLKNLSGQKKNQPRTTLILVPPSLIFQWNEEIKKFFPKLHGKNTHVFYGKDRINDPKKLAKFDIVLASYYLINKLPDIKWLRVMLDEAHLIKNEGSQIAENCYAIEAVNRWCITGTPIQNSLKDFYSLLKFIRHRYFADERTWEMLYQGYRAHKPQFVHLMQILARETILRRMKHSKDQNGNSILPDLPKIEIMPPEICHFQLDPAEKYDFPETRAYALLDPELNPSLRNRFQQMINQVQSQEVKTRKGNMFQVLNRIRHAPIHMSLTDQKYTINKPYQEKYNPKELEIEQLKALFNKRHPSSKIRKMLEIVRSLKEDEKCVIVSEWTNVLDLVREFLENDSPRIGTITIEGSSNPAEKMKRIEQFEGQKTYKVLLLSLLAGGVGLNLQVANVMIFMEPHWNPALELQARDRIYRMDQKKLVRIYNLIAKDTIEEKVILKQKEKIILAKNVLRGASAEMHDFTIDDINVIVGLKKMSSPVFDQSVGSPALDILNPYGEADEDQRNPLR